MAWHLGVTVAFCLSVVGELVGISPSPYHVQNALRRAIGILGEEVKEYGGATSCRD